MLPNDITSQSETTIQVSPHPGGGGGEREREAERERERAKPLWPGNVRKVSPRCQLASEFLPRKRSLADTVVRLNNVAAAECSSDNQWPKDNVESRRGCSRCSCTTTCWCRSRRRSAGARCSRTCASRTTSSLLSHQVSLPPHPGVELRANLKSISNRCHLFKVTFLWELIKEIMHLPLGCLPVRGAPGPVRLAQPAPCSPARSTLQTTQWQILSPFLTDAT